MYRNVKGSRLTTPTETFFQPPKKNIQSKHFPDHVYSNYVQQLTTNNTIYFIEPTAHIEQFQNSFFVKTIVDWNQLNESQVKAETITDFSRLICGS